jgi:hypothetical protein
VVAGVLIYVNRMMENDIITLNWYSGKFNYIIVALFILYEKMYQDNCYCNRIYARIFNIDLVELNKIEIRIIQDIDLGISVEESFEMSMRKYAIETYYHVHAMEQISQQIQQVSQQV